MKTILIGLILIACIGVNPERIDAAEPTLAIRKEGEFVVLDWPPDALALGYVLQSTPALTNVIWNVVPGITTNPVQISPQDIAQYYRLNQSGSNGAVVGVVQSGGASTNLPYAGVTVTLYEATTNQPAVLGQTITDAAGRFALSSSKATTEGVFFVTAALSEDVQLLAIIGPTLPATATINELTTVAGAYAMAQFYRDGVISGDHFGLRLAAMMNENLVDVATGESSLVLLSSPNGDQSNSLRSTRSLANVLAACATDRAVAATFRHLAQDPRSPAPATTPQAMANLARHPGQNVADIYYLSTIRTPFRAALFEPPDAWTITVKVNDSGDDNHLISGCGFLVFDSKGYAWVTDNSVQGTPYSSRFMFVLKPNGKPADGADGTPRSPITTGGLLGGGYGITIDPQGSVWVGNFGWGPDHSCLFYPSTNAHCNGSVSQFTPAGEAISGPLGYQGGPVRAQGLDSDAEGNIWICSYGDDSIYVFLKGSPTNVVHHKEYPGSQPFHVRLGPDGTAWVANGGGITGAYPSSLARYRLKGNQLERLWLVPLGSAVKGFSLDSRKIAWVASQGDSTVYAVAPEGYVIDGFNGGGVDGPWGATVDGEDNVWVANFGPLRVAPFAARLSKLAGSNPNTRPPGLNLGDPISPETGYTVPSAGAEVLLHDGTPLYGWDGPLAYEPFQRMTAVAIDQAGNLWALNNWKNKFGIDTTANPGGDGIVIFVGLAAPPKPTRP